MKIPNCPQSIFRPREANLYCTKPQGHGGVHVFGDGTVRVDGVDTKPKPPDSTDAQKGNANAQG